MFPTNKMTRLAIRNWLVQQGFENPVVRLYAKFTLANGQTLQVTSASISNTWGISNDSLRLTEVG